MKPGGRQRLRLRYRKDDVLMYISHRDLLRLVFKLLRRAEIPFAFSGHFSPKPRVTFGPALSLGVSADNELLDIELPDSTAWDAQETEAALKRLAQAALPRDFAAGMTGLSPGQPSIAAEVKAARYHVTGDAGLETGYLIPRAPALLEGTGGADGPLRGLLSLEAHQDMLVIDGLVQPSGSFSIVRAGTCLRDTFGLRYTRLHRACLLGEDGMPL